MNIIPVSYNLLSAQIRAVGKKVERLRSEHGTLFKDEKGEGVRMTLEDSAVFHKMMRNLDNPIRAFNMLFLDKIK